MPEDYNAAANNKNVKDALKLFLDDATDTLIGLEVDRRDTFAEAASRPIERKLTTKWITEDGTPSEAPPLLNEYEDQKATAEEQNMVSDTPYDQRARYIASPEIDSVRGEDGNIMTFAPDIFSTPLNQRQARAINLLDKDGNATERGKLFHGLSEAGMFDEAGVLTEKGKAYLVDEKDLGKRENLQAFKTQFDDGIVRGDATFEEISGSIGKMLVDAGAGVRDMAWNEIQGYRYNGLTPGDRRPQELKDRTRASELGFREGAAANLMETVVLADVGTAWMWAEFQDPANWGEYGVAPEDSQEELYAARQRQWQMRQDVANLEAGESMEVLLGAEGVVAEAEAIKGRMGEKEFNKRYGRAGAFAQFVVDPTNLIPLAFATKVARLAPLSTRALLGAQRVMGRGLREQLKVGAQEVLVESLKGTIERGTRTVRRTTRFIEKASVAGADPVAIARGKQAAEIAGRATRITDEAKSLLPKAIADLDAATAARNSLTTLIPEKAANAFIKTMEVGRQARGLPAKTIGSILERAGDTVTKVDGAVTNFLTERGLNQAYTAAISAAGVAGVTVGSPIVGAIGATAAALKTGKMISNYGKLFKYVGKEMTQVRGQIPFWKRAAAHTAPGSFNRGIAHTFNVMDLGGVTSDVLRRTGRGIAAAAPTDLMFEYLSDGADMRPQTFMQAGAESLVIGGSFAAAGGAFMGTKSRMRELAIGDQLNFIQGMVDPVQKGLFNVLSPGNRNALGTYAIANPTLIYNFKDSGPSEYDPNTNTASINVRSNNPIKAVIAHETLHHTVIKNNMEGGLAALFFGDTVTNTTGGILRSKDGKFDPNFEEFKNAYYDRLGVAGMTDAEKNAIYPINKIGVEYFIEKHADQYASMAESGELGAISGSTELSRKFSSILETVLPRIPILKDLHFKSGGMIDKDGGWVTGNGLLDADGIKTDPITKKMFRDMNRRSSGLAPGQFEPLMSDKRDSGAQIILDPSNAIDSELLHPLIRIDENNEPVLENGKPVALDKATLLERSLAGLTAKEVLRRKKAENYIPEKGEAHMDDAGEFQTGWLANDVLTEIFAKNRYNPEQKRILREVNRLVRKGTGDRVVMINFPATTRNKAGKVVYKAQGATIRDTVPVAITISKDGNLLFGLMSVTKLHENIQKRSQSRRGKKLYGGNVDLILQDTQAMMQFHKDGIDSIEHFKAKYGAVEATERKNFINTMFGLLNQKEQAVLNPMLIEDGIKSRDNVYRTYRADRVSKAVAMSPDEHPAMPFSYEATSQVKMPEQVMQMPEDYRGQHTAPNRDGGSPIHDLANTYPDDIYSSKAERYYGHWGDARDAAAIRVIQSLKGKENASVKIYRAVPKYDAGANHTSISEANAKLSSLQRMAKSSPHLWDDPMFREQVNNLESQIPSKSKLAINSGDWVTTVKSYARDHGESALNGNYDILSKTVKAKDIFTNGDSIFEWGYDPETGASDPRYMPEAVDKDKFYSQLDRVISEKIPSRATPQQIMATIDPTRGSGVKADEIKWSGIEQALESLKKDGKVSKEDLLNYLRDDDRVGFKEVRSKIGESMGAQDFSASDLVLPGGENYREVVLAMPIKSESLPEGWRVEKPNEYNPNWRVFSDKGYQMGRGATEDAAIAMANDSASDPQQVGQKARAKSTYTSSHFPDVPNYVAHMRTNERTDGDGNPGLFVEEFQSDRHQEGRKRGYDTERGVDIATKEFNRIVKPSKDVDSKEMQELVLSTNPRMIEWVKESLGQDYDRIRELAMQDRQSVPDAPFRTTWPLQLFKRALRDAVDSKKDWIGWTVGETQNDRFDLSKQVGEIRHWKSDEEGYYGVQVIEPNGQTIMHEDEMISTDKLADLVGKDVAQRIVDGEGEDIGNNARSLSGDNLKVGGSGMKGFYDNMLPKEIGKYVKQWGGKVEKTRLDTLEYADVGRNSGNGKYYLYDEKGNPLDKEYDTYDEAKAAGETPIWRIDITQQMRESVPQGQARYMPEALGKIPESEGGNLKPSTWKSLESVGYKPSASEKTQIPTTAATYERIVNANAEKGMRVLDFAAGRGNGTASIKKIGKSKGFDVSGYEPYSNPKTRAISPEYEGMDSLAQIPNNSYDLIINNAVLNVVPESVGRGIARDIYSKLAPEGSAFINVMGWSNIKSRLKNPKTKLVGPREVVTQKGTFQKGYTTETLRALIESELPDAKVVRTNYGDIGFKVTKPPVKIVKEEISMPTGIPNIPSGNKRFLPEPVEKLSAFAGKRVQVLTSDLSIVKNIQHGKYTAKFEGGPGYLDNDGWAFTSKEAADAFATRWRKDGEPLIGLASLGPANHLNSLDARKAYGEKWKSLVDSKVLNEKDVSSHIQEAMARIVESNSKSVKPAWKEVAGKIKNANDLAEYFDKIPWAAAPMFYGKLTAKTLPISHKRLVEHKLDLDSVAKEYRQPEFHESKLGDLYAIAEYDGSVPDYKPELNKAYPWRIKFSKRATLSEMHNVADLTTDPRAFAGKKVGGRLGAQPLMVTGINLDRLMVGDLKASGKPLTMHPETAKTKSDVAKGFGSGNPSGYRPYSSEPSKPIKKSKSTTKIKTSAKSILDVAKMK